LKTPAILLLSALAITALPEGDFRERAIDPEGGLAPRSSIHFVVEESDPDSARRDFMRTKLMYSQNILEGLTTDDFKEIQAAVRELQRVTDGEQWLVVDAKEYRQHSDDFKKSLRRLQEAAATKNIDATALRFHELSLRCIDCHKHVRKADYEL